MYRAYYSLVCAMLIGCSSGTSQITPIVELPVSYSSGERSAAAVNSDWWQQFNSEELTRFIETALNENNDLGAGLARIKQARALLQISGSTLFPTIDAGAGYDIVRQNNSGTIRVIGTNVNLSYQIDIFGQNRAGVKSSRENLKATAFEMDSLALVVASDVAVAYFNTLGLRERLTVADQNLESIREVLEIIEAQHRAGRVSELEVAQQRSIYASSLASRAAIEEQLKNAENALHVLMGRPPRTLEIIKTDLSKINVPDIASGIPSELLSRRPDIAASEARLKSANADIDVARASFLPSFDIRGGWSLAATGLSDPSSTLLTAISAVTAPIFQGGRLQGELRQATARQEELTENYLKTILVALQEVEDAIAGVDSSRKRESNLNEARVQAQIAYDLSQHLYDAGSINFLTLIDTQRTLLNLRDSYIQSKLARVTAAVALYRSLGGGWENYVNRAL